MATIRPEKKTRTTVDTIVFTRAECEKWKSPPFQRELRVNDKVRELSGDIAHDGVIPGVLTLGKIGHEVYLLDGQHRRAAFLLTELREGFADVRIHTFDTMAEMGEEFVLLNSQLVRLRPDDVLRGMEGSSLPLRLIREKCPYVGYDNVRRNEKAPLLSASLLLRNWAGSMPETPKSSTESALHLSQSLSMDEAKVCAKFTNMMFNAWGRSEDTRRMWGGLNLVLCAWLYRRLVLMQQPAVKRAIKLNDAEFEKCLMSLGSNDKYNDWLHGRTLNERNRAPAFNRIKEIFARRMMAERGLTTKPLMPQPPWASSHGGGGRPSIV